MRFPNCMYIANLVLRPLAILRHLIGSYISVHAFDLRKSSCVDDQFPYGGFVLICSFQHMYYAVRAINASDIHCLIEEQTILILFMSIAFVLQLNSCLIDQLSVK